MCATDHFSSLLTFIVLEGPERPGSMLYNLLSGIVEHLDKQRAFNISVCCEGQSKNTLSTLAAAWMVYSSFASASRLWLS